MECMRIADNEIELKNRRFSAKFNNAAAPASQPTSRGAPRIAMAGKCQTGPHVAPRSLKPTVLICMTRSTGRCMCMPAHGRRDSWASQRGGRQRGTSFRGRSKPTFCAAEAPLWRTLPNPLQLLHALSTPIPGKVREGNTQPSPLVSRCAGGCARPPPSRIRRWPTRPNAARRRVVVPAALTRRFRPLPADLHP